MPYCKYSEAHQFFRRRGQSFDHKCFATKYTAVVNSAEIDWHAALHLEIFGFYIRPEL